MSREEKEGIGQPMEMQILRVVKEEGYPLGASNNYGDSLIHLSAANDYNHIIREILKKKVSTEINWKNDCGWTPFMQAIRNGNTEAVKLLLANGYTPGEDPYEDISPIGLAAAMGLEMFEIVYSACPAALDYAKHNTISPLCAAVVREDKQLFFRLLDLGVDVAEASECTLTLMRQSRIPEIAKLAEAHSAAKDYWTENCDTMDCVGYLPDNFRNPRMSSTLDNIEESDEYDEDEPEDARRNFSVPTICVSPPSDMKISERRNSEPLRLNIPTSADAPKSLISPRLVYTRRQTFPVSPNPTFVARKKEEKSESRETPDDTTEDFHDDLAARSLDGKMLFNSTFTDESKVHKYKINRPPNLNISQDDDGGGSLEYSLEYENSNASTSSATPTEPRHEAPSTAIFTDEHQKKLACLLQRFGLTHLIFTFLAEEVDLDLFFTLNDQDLQEIGIANKSDRLVVLQVINQCTGHSMKSCLSH